MDRRNGNLIFCFHSDAEIVFLLDIVREFEFGMVRHEIIYAHLYA